MIKINGLVRNVNSKNSPGEICLINRKELIEKSRKIKSYIWVVQC